MEKKREERYYDKISHLEKYLTLVQNWNKKEEIENYIKINSYKEIFAIYHAIQLITEIIADISAMIVKDIKNYPKDDYSNFQVLRDRDIISNDLYQSIKDLNGLRNRIVHDYNGLDDNIAFKSINNNFNNILEFKEKVIQWLLNQ